jgi:hypothetical protein
MRLFHCAFILTATINASCVCILALFNGVFRSECILGEVSSGGSILRATVVMFITAAAMAVFSSAVFLFRPRPRHAVARLMMVASQCVRWKPAWFIVLSVQKLILRAIVIPNAGASNKRLDRCPLSSIDEMQFHAATFMWDCSALLMGAWVILCDLDADFPPVLRRCAHSVLAACLAIEAVGSYIWGNELAGQVSLSLGALEFVLDNQMTSCITSQAIIALHFMFTSCRSLDGRGWAYAALRFELEEGCKIQVSPHSLPQLREPLSDMSGTAGTNQDASAASKFDADSTSSDKVPQTTGPCGLFFRLQQIWLSKQLLGMTQYQVFVVPCVRIHDEVSDSVFALARPTFELRCLRPLQRIADAHPKRYVRLCAWCLALPDVLCVVFLSGDIKGISTLFLNCLLVIALLGFLSSKCHNLDRVAVKHVVTSFRFGVCAVSVLATFIIEVRRAYLTTNPVASMRYKYQTSYWAVAAVALLIVLFGICLLLDCSPHFPATSQFAISVS